MNTPYHQKYEEMKRAAKIGSIALLNDCDGYIAFGPDADKLLKHSSNCKYISGTILIENGPASFGQTTIPIEHLEETVIKLAQAGDSVSLLDRVQKDMKLKPQIVRVWFVQGTGDKKQPTPVKQEEPEDFC
jgi:hypothetical protein